SFWPNINKSKSTRSYRTGKSTRSLTIKRTMKFVISTLNLSFKKLNYYIMKNNKLKSKQELSKS
ncbi:hypothetical protein KUA25_29255, partial [Bacteroidales bacterium MSK.15.36]|nr:hypothetical protein [Bacteroidales bacterium MSK.15.36]